MRLAGIRDMAAAQAFLPAFMARHNARFAVAPKREEDAHKPWARGTEALDAALATHEPRTLSKALTFSAGGAIHCIRTTGAGIALRGAKVTVRRYLDGRMDVLFKDRILSYTTPAAACEPNRGRQHRSTRTLMRSSPEQPLLLLTGWPVDARCEGPDLTTAPPQAPTTSHHPSTLRGASLLSGTRDISILG